MATKVSYKQGTKAKYLSLDEHLSTALYWCTDTRELFKGDDLYTDGARFVDNKESLPAYELAADGKLYICLDNGNGYVLNEDRNAWVQVIYGVDGTTIGLTTAGLMEVKAVPVDKINGLDEKVAELVQAEVGSLTPDVATSEKAGIVKPSVEFTVGPDGLLSVASISTKKVDGLEARLLALESGTGDAEALDDIIKAITWEDMA